MTADRPAILTIREAAAEAGVKIGVLYGAMKRGDIKSLPRTGMEHRFARAEFERWLAGYVPRSRGGLRSKFKGE